MKKYYVYFIDYRGYERCHYFEYDNKTAEHFAKVVNGKILRDY